MKVLYAIQGTGNGHLSRARTFIPALRDKVDLDLLISGIQADVKLPYPLDYKLTGLSFIFGKNGGIDYPESIKRLQPVRLMKDIQTLPVEKYDLVINDFEPVSAWACHFKNKKCIGLSHQAAVLHPDAPKTEKNDLLGTMVLKYYAPVSHQFGFHFERYADNIYTPVIRPEIRAAEPTEKNHVTVYLPSYSDKRIFNILRQIKDVTWHVFSKHSRTEKSKDNVLLKPVSNQAFIESLITGEAVLCGAGFQTPSEALYLGKKLMVIPMKMQYEQQLNAVALARLGISVIDELTNQNIPILVDWLKNGKTIKMDYPDHTEAICDIVLSC